MSLPIPSTSGTTPVLDPKELQAMDAPLIALTNACGGDLRRLMFAYFSFLQRRTDFYLVPHEDDVKAGKYMGFPEGDAEKFLLAAFRQFPLRKIPKGGPQRAPAPAGGAKASAAKPAEKAPVEKETKKETATAIEPKADSETKPKEEEASTEKPVATEASESSSNDKKPEAQPTTTTAKNMEGVRYNEEGLQIPIGNGGSTPKYKWTQMIDECSVLVGVPEGLRGKDLDIEITSTSLSVKTKKPLPGQSEPLTLVEGKLSHKVRADESTWSMEGGVVIITLDKMEKTFWKNVLEGDEEIDTEEVDNRRHISEYDNATQGQIRKIIFDQNQYHLGGKTSDEILGEKGEKIQIPEMPPGVEYIDQKKLDQVQKSGGAKPNADANAPKQKYTIDLDKK